MSTIYRPTIVGLVSPGLFWLAASVAQGQGSPSPQGLPTIPAPASSSTFSVLLMSNGTVVRGEITDDPAAGAYRLKIPGGQVPYPKTRVKRAGHSIEELYRYQVEALPKGDPEERMKLVRWCLTEHLPGFAREQLADVLKICPDDPVAERMAKNLEANAENNDRDPAVQQTSGEVPRGDAPATLDPGIVKKVRKGFGNNLPEIFDLPPAVAVPLASKFAELVQPVLQMKCAGCHNEKYQGEFQLVPVRTRKDLQNPDVARANLDAALRLVNPNDFARSDLLSAGLVPHGPNKGAIFTGPNDRQYKVLVTWVRSLGSSTAAESAKAGGSNHVNEGVTRTGYVPAGSADGFASDRQGRSSASLSSGTDTTGGKLPTYTPPGASRTINEINESADFSGGTATDFPVLSDVLNSAAGGRAPATMTPTTRNNPASGPGRRSAPSMNLPTLPTSKPTRRPAPREVVDEAPSDPVVSPTTAVEVSPGTVAVEMDDNPNNLPGMNQPKYPKAKPKAQPDPVPDDEAPKPAPSRKKPKVDPALLEKMIKQRNAPNP